MRYRGINPIAIPFTSKCSILFWNKTNLPSKFSKGKGQSLLIKIFKIDHHPQLTIKALTAPPPKETGRARNLYSRVQILVLPSLFWSNERARLALPQDLIEVLRCTEMLQEHLDGYRREVVGTCAIASLL